MEKDNIGGEKAIIEERRRKLDQLRDKGDAYGNSFKPQNNARSLHEEYGTFSKEETGGLVIFLQSSLKNHVKMLSGS